MNAAPKTNDDRLILLAPADNVFVARGPIAQGEMIVMGGQSVRVPATISVGHKLARHAIATGDKVLKHGAPIGSATTPISPGDHVHLHNLKSDYTATYSLDAAEADHLSATGESRI